MLVMTFTAPVTFSFPPIQLTIVKFNHKQAPCNSDHLNKKNNSLRILQWNCQGLHSKLASLQFIAQDYDLICVQEFLLHDTKRFYLKDFHVIRKDITGPGLRGICSLIRTNIPYSSVDLDDISHPSMEVLGISVHINDTPCLIINIYRHPGLSTPYTVFEKLLSYQNKFPHILLLGDFNAHHIY